jgi:hypothetical protein
MLSERASMLRYTYIACLVIIDLSLGARIQPQYLGMVTILQAGLPDIPSMHISHQIVPRGPGLKLITLPSSF